MKFFFFLDAGGEAVRGTEPIISAMAKRHVVTATNQQTPLWRVLDGPEIQTKEERFPHTQYFTCRFFVSFFLKRNIFSIKPPMGVLALQQRLGLFPFCWKDMHIAI